MTDRQSRRARELAKRRAARGRGAPPPRRSLMPWIVAGLGVVVGLALVVAIGGGKKHPAAQPAPSALVRQVTSVPTSAFDTVGAGDVQHWPSALLAPAEVRDGKPVVLYVGAEYCPYCAAQRWAMITALSRFGTFAHLSTTHSSSTDVYASTPTFTFHGSTFTSDYLVFEPVETAGNELSGGTYPPLETPTAHQEQVVQAYDAPPLTDTRGAIPFLFIGGKYGVSGAMYDPRLFAGKRHGDIASALRDPSSKIARSVLAAANGLSAAICATTGDQPASVCSSAGVVAARANL
ncbi:MAG TPA: DUF929 family protein [Acidimicrobiales bacterium]|nr:DUF929 family protein [Acidimicrobiales bacterium]